MRAKLSSIASAARTLLVGAGTAGSASSSFSRLTSRLTSLACARGELGVVSEMMAWQCWCGGGSLRSDLMSDRSSAVLPEYETRIRTSTPCGEMEPRSPCSASTGCRKALWMPAERNDVSIPTEYVTRAEAGDEPKRT